MQLYTSKMSNVLRLTLNLVKTSNLTRLRPFSSTPKLLLKEITETQVGKELVIEGAYSDSVRTPYLVKTEHVKCSLCALNLEVKHTDVLILSQFVRSDGCMLPRRVTGLCRMQQKRVSTLVTMAQKSGLLAILNPAKSKKDPKLRYGYKKYNKYFDEATIPIRGIYTRVIKS